MLFRTKFMIFGAALITLLAWTLLDHVVLPAAAQGGAVCDYGSAMYKRCCRESYGENPKLGARARSDDINACMKDRDPPRDQPASRRDRNDDTDSKPSRQGSKRNDAPAKGSGSGAGITRMDCASVSCTNGCDEEEIAISAFCNVGASPSPAGDRKILCATSGAGVEMPKVLICAKK